MADLLGDSNAAVWAHLRAGHEFLTSAAAAAFNDRAGAKEDLKFAREHFEAALADDDAPAAARAQALYGLASVQEASSDGDVAAAKESYGRLVTDYPDSPLVPAAEMRLKVLDGPPPARSWRGSTSRTPCRRI